MNRVLWIYSISMTFLMACGALSIKPREINIYTFSYKDQTFYKSKKQGIFLKADNSETDGFRCLPEKDFTKIIEKLKTCN